MEEDTDQFFDTRETEDSPIGKASKEAFEKVNKIIRGNVTLHDYQIAAGNQFRQVINNVHCLFIRAILVAFEKKDKETIERIRTWCSQHGVQIHSFRDDRMTLSFFQNEELDDWLDHQDPKTGVRKPAPVFEHWMPLSVAQCRIWYPSGIPACDIVAAHLKGCYYMQSRSFLLSENEQGVMNYVVLQSLLSQPPSVEEQAIRLPTVNRRGTPPPPGQPFAPQQQHAPPQFPPQQYGGPPYGIQPHSSHQYAQGGFAHQPFRPDGQPNSAFGQYGTYLFG